MIVLNSTMTSLPLSTVTLSGKGYLVDQTSSTGLATRSALTSCAKHISL